MQFKIDGQNYDLEFGMKAIRTLDEIYKVDYQGLEFGMGINLAFMGLHQYNPATLSDVIRASVSHVIKRPKQGVIDKAVEDYAKENGDLEKLFNDVLDELGNSQIATATIEKFKEDGAAENLA